ncbi:MAG TPA: BTAD domain-containing putative transcriptional regulator [Microthrixaceae bacterium]|nr:BTAD domain-containing putative transcriptional regulator [Microthrixaceae bacterium]
MAVVEPPPVRVAEVRLLGGVDAVTTDGTTIGIPSATQRRLLAVLAVNAPRRLRGEWLAELLGISPGALRRALTRLRGTIGPDAVVTAPTGYALACDVDAHRFVRDIAAVDGAQPSSHLLEAALGRWSGPPLEEFDTEDWARSDVLRLNELHAGATDDLADALIRERRAVEALALLEPHIERHPYRDRPWGLLIRSLALAGRQAEALRAYQRYRTLLDAEVGTEPSPDVMRIERRVATGWNGLDDAPTATPVRDPGSETAFHIPLPRTLSQATVASGRERLRRMLRNEVDLLDTGSRRGVVLVGESGIGRTTLLADLGRSVTEADAAVVLYGQCRDNSAPLEPFREMLTSCVEHLPLPVLMDHVALCGGELVRLCPRLAERVRTTPDPTDTDDATARHLTFDAAADLLRRITEHRPLVVMIDDLHRAEPTALLLLRHLAIELVDTPLLLIGTLRHSGTTRSEELRTTLAELAGHDGRTVEITGFDEDELAEMVTHATGPTSGATARERARVLLAQTAGNPLFASQLLQHWTVDDLRHVGDDDTQVATTEIPLGLREVVWNRVRALGDDTTAVLVAAAVLGTEFDEDVLLDTVEVDRDAVRRSLDAATSDRLLIAIHPARKHFRFVHALVAAALVAETGAADLARLHERSARSLERHIAADNPRLAVEMARHTLLAGQPAEALRWTILAGDHALTGLAPAEAARHYRSALEMAAASTLPDPERVDVAVRLGEALHRSGDPAALDTLAHAADEARRTGNDAALIRAALAADRGFVRIDDRAAEQRGIVEAALRVVDSDDVGNRARLLALSAQTLVSTLELDRRIDIAQHAWALANSSRDPALVARVGPAVLAALWTPGRTRQRSEIASATVAAAESSGDPRLQFAAHLAAFEVAIETAQAGTAARSLARLRATARSVGEPRLRWITGLCDTFDATMRGRLDDAERVATETLELGTRTGVSDAFTIFAAQYFVLGTFAGRHAELSPLVEQAMRDNPGSLPFTLAHGIVCASVGRLDEARRILRRGRREGFDTIAVDNVWMTSIIGYAVLAIELSDAEAAAQILPLIEPHAGEVAFNGATSQGPVAAYAGKLCSLLGRHDEAEEHLESAIGAAMDFGWPYHRATTLYALAEDRWRRDGHLDEDARSWLREATELCRQGGFDSWLPRIEDLEGRVGDALVTRVAVEHRNVRAVPS